MESDPLSQLPVAPQWSVLVGDTGSVAVVVAAICFFLAAIFGFLSRRKPSLERWAVGLFGAGCLSLVTVLAMLATLFLNDRFEWAYVRGHSDLAAPAAYKFAAVWSGQEGSFLLWACCSAIFVLFTLRPAGPYRGNYVAISSLFLAAIAGILTYESPFILSTIHGKPLVPPDGVGLAPSLLNYWVIIHPPTIFLGFGSLIVPFAMALAALIQGDPTDWVQRVRSTSFVSLALLGLGLCMGGFWAYETLGWGGFWAWDPVENTSFVPWCILTAFVHSVLVQQSRRRWVNTTILLGGLPFLSFLYGTFLTRSGFLGDTSVHSFAEMERSALYILAGLGLVCILGFVGLSIFRWRSFKTQFETGPSRRVEGTGRESLYAAGNSLLVIFALATGFGMSVPLVMRMAGRKPSMVEESVYHQVLPWFFLPILLLMALAPYVSWNGTKLRVAFGKLYGPLCVTIFIVGCLALVMSWTQWAGEIKNEGQVSMMFGLFNAPRVPWTMFLAGCCIFVVVANAWRLVAMAKTSKLGTAPFLAHIGVGVLLSGLILSRGLEQKQDLIVQDFDTATAMGYLISPKGPNGDILDRNNKIKIDVQKIDSKPVQFTPGFYWRRGNDGQLSPMAWPFVHREAMHDVYMALHGMEFNATEATLMKPGQTVKFDRYNVTFQEMTREGNPGQPGTKFGAKLKAVDPQIPGSVEDDIVHNIEPKWVLGENGVEQEPGLLGDEFFMTIQSMDADSKSVSLQLHFRQPIYVVELFVKPFTPLVWIGTGTLTFALLMAAFYRRPKAPMRDPLDANVVEEKAAEPQEHATVTTAQS